MFLSYMSIYSLEPLSYCSQFISSLLLIAPTLQKGLTLTIEGEIVSKPYIQMTLKLMKECGIYVCESVAEIGQKMKAALVQQTEAIA